MDWVKIFENQDIAFLLESLDSLQNAISIYDSDLRLIYANQNYFRNMFFEDKEDAIGKTIDELMEEYGTHVFAIEANKECLEFKKVIEYGTSVLNWEVKTYPESDPDRAKILVYDMYPIRDPSDGSVEGVIEVSHLQQNDLKIVNNMMGFRAKYDFDSIIAESEIMKNRIRQAAIFAESPLNLHIYGESGVGKELFAQAIHNASRYRKGPFVALNCASFPEGLIESELFGYVGGAFTGASKKGQVSKFELADGGTLFLDEIGEMPLQFQAKLLRVLETGTVTRIGSSTAIPFNTRILSATNRDLKQMVAEGRFRQDLYYRLEVLSVEIPPLRERGRDVVLIADHFLKTAAEQSGEEKKSLSKEAEDVLMEYRWPGNVRELRNIIERISVLMKGRVIRAEDVQAVLNARGAESAGGYRQGSFSGPVEEMQDLPPEEQIGRDRETVRQAQVRLLRDALRLSGGSKSGAAELLGISRKTLYNLLHRYEIE
ncbi:MAG: sigma-54 interaction domain-containing protein [Anaerovoracaceae bacterium]|jgi:transcriptional regulator with PAS, ATPase and Fis domain